MLGVAPVARGQDEPDEPDDGWEMLSHDIELEESTLRIEVGVPMDEGCLFSGEDESSSDPRIVVDWSVAINVELCLAVMERGYLPDQEAADWAEADAGAATAVELPLDAAGDDAAGEVLSAVPAVPRKHAWHRTFWEDPPGIDVNGVKVNVRWSYDGRCAYDSSHWTDYDWFSPSGWRKIESNTRTHKACDARTTSSYAHFKNAAFCATVDTDTYYDRTVIVGRKDGGYTMGWDSYVRGGCSTLLRFSRAHGWASV